MTSIGGLAIGALWRNVLGSGARSLLLAAAIVIVVGGLRVSASVLVPILLGVVAAIALLPPLRWLSNKGVPQGLGLLVIAGVLVAGFGVVGAMLAATLDDFRASLPTYQLRVSEIERHTLGRLAAMGLRVPEEFDFSALLSSNLMAMASTAASSVAGLLSNLVFVLLVAVFALSESVGFRDKLVVAFGGDPLESGSSGGVVAEIQAYLNLKTVTSAATGLVVGLVLALGRVDFALLWGVLAFLLNYIPTLGSIIAAIPAVAIVLLEQGTGSALLVSLLYLAVNMIIGNIIEPRLMGRTMGLSPLVVLLSMIFWGWVLGLVGALLAVPLTMIVKIVAENSDDMRYVAVLLGPPLRRSGDRVVMG